MGKLDNAKHEIFCLEYVKDFNAGQAYIRAGYSEKGARQGAFTLLTNIDVQERIRELTVEKEGLIVARILHELAVLMFSDIRNYQVNADGSMSLMPGVPDCAARAVSSIKQKYSYDRDGNPVGGQTEIRLWSKEKAIELFMRHVGMLVDRKELTGRDGGPIEIDEAKSHIANAVTSLAAAIESAKGSDKPK